MSEFCVPGVDLQLVNMHGYTNRLYINAELEVFFNDQAQQLNANSALMLFAYASMYDEPVPTRQVAGRLIDIYNSLPESKVKEAQTVVKDGSLIAELRGNADMSLRKKAVGNHIFKLGHGVARSAVTMFCTDISDVRFGAKNIARGTAIRGEPILKAQADAKAYCREFGRRACNSLFGGIKPTANYKKYVDRVEGDVALAYRNSVCLTTLE